MSDEPRSAFPGGGEGQLADFDPTSEVESDPEYDWEADDDDDDDDEERREERDR